MLRTRGPNPPTVTAAMMLTRKSAMSHQPLASPFELRQRTVWFQAVDGMAQPAAAGAGLLFQVQFGMLE